jgi:hypothetical protein
MNSNLLEYLNKVTNSKKSAILKKSVIKVNKIKTGGLPGKVPLKRYDNQTK